MATILPRDQVVDALDAEFTELDALMSALADTDWRLPTALPGWDVGAVFAHVIGTESSLAGEPSPPELPPGHDVAHVRNDIGSGNERWVVALAPASPRALLDRFRAVTATRLTMLRSLSDHDWDAEGFTPAGPDTYGRFMRIRVFDCWMHEQDIRAAVGRPGHLSGPVVDLALDEMSAAMGFVVGKKAAAPKGSSVTFELSGPAPRTIHVLVDGRALVVDALDGPATVTLQLPSPAFTRLGGGRVRAGDVEREVVIVGDHDLGRRVLANLGYTI